ncbi:MAG: transposase [Chitinophagales bacterium]
MPNIADLQTIRKTYQQRWQIEVFFKHCKTNGFNLEDMNVTQTNKVMLMVAIVGCAYVLAYST